MTLIVIGCKNYQQTACNAVPNDTTRGRSKIREAVLALLLARSLRQQELLLLPWPVWPEPTASHRTPPGGQSWTVSFTKASTAPTNVFLPL